jgi:hypothetical protein
MLNETWEDQYKRMRRSLEALRQASRKTATPHIDARDVVHSFCCDAFHLMYWIQKVPLQTDVRGLVFNNRISGEWSPALAICADIANGAKHLTLGQQASAVTGSKQGYAEIASRSIEIGVPQAWGEQPTSGGYNTASWTVTAGGTEYDALDIAERAVTDWDAWLIRHGLGVPR